MIVLTRAMIAAAIPCGMELRKAYGGKLVHVWPCHQSCIDMTLCGKELVRRRTVFAGEPMCAKCASMLQEETMEDE